MHPEYRVSEKELKLSREEKNHDGNDVGKKTRNTEERSGNTKLLVLQGSTRKVCEWTDDLKYQELISRWTETYSRGERGYRKAYKNWRDQIKLGQSCSAAKKPTAPLTSAE